MITKSNLNVLEANKDLQSDHIGFHDEHYKNRRKEIVDKTRNFDPIIRNFEHIDYLESENQTWNKVFTVLKELYPKVACIEYNNNFQKLVDEQLFSETNIPELGEISNYIERNTGFKLYPVSGLLSPKQFLIGLSNKTFYCTQYIRHHSNPFYTPEPDIIHEMLGHIPLFLDQDICDISYLIGCAAKFCNDEQIKELEKIYWFSIEFGVLKDGKIYGAGILS
jgi:phenylalanine-4-hydroxylase